ncbi:hypothetical protein DPM33_35005 [Mesorhizobium hawassense]|uniref:Uncharacterized protein n=1 Tax=Mesorhizobium hawassense TaxID=1209954 RepID=A0A330H757_9HYPH|nr:hypothetical protein DPM33_35005 [Mesorhizobium hawassense]
MSLTAENGANSKEEEALIVAFRRHTLLPLDDCLYTRLSHRRPTFSLVVEAGHRRAVAVASTGSAQFAGAATRAPSTPRCHTR